MSLPLIFACLWVIAGTFVAFLPMRFQYAPGVLLLMAAPCLLLWIGMAHGMVYAVVGGLGFVSMFRRPLGFLLRRVMGANEEVPQ